MTRRIKFSRQLLYKPTTFSYDKNVQFAISNAQNEIENKIQNTETGKFETNFNNTIDHTIENLISVHVQYWPTGQYTHICMCRFNYCKCNVADKILYH